MKNIKSDTAASAVTYACRLKFPAKNEPAYVAPEETVISVLSALGEVRPALNALITKIDVVSVTTVQTGTNIYGVKSYDYGRHLNINVTNRNNFPINTIVVAIPKKKGPTCSWNSDFYAEIYKCKGTAGWLGSGQFTCQIPDLDRRNPMVCLVGFGILGTKSELTEFKKKNAIPNRQN